MLSVSIVLIAIVGTINIANYISTNQALDARLSLIADNGGYFFSQIGNIYPYDILFRF